MGTGTNICGVGGNITINPGAGGAASCGSVNTAGASGNVLLATIAGNVGIGTTGPGAQLQVNAGASTTIGAIIKGAASQSANLQEWQNSAGTVLSSINSIGDFTGVRGRFTVDSSVALVVEAANGTDMLNISTSAMLATWGGSQIIC